MQYLAELGVKLDEPVLLVILAELDAPTMGEFSREGFVQGWTSMRYLIPSDRITLSLANRRINCAEPTQYPNNKLRSHPYAAPSPQINLSLGKSTKPRSY